jgi:ATP-dependent DNA helicase Q1
MRFCLSINIRANLRYSVRKKDSGSKLIKQLADVILEHRKESGIIYCLSRKDTETICEALQILIPSMRSV